MRINDKTADHLEKILSNLKESKAQNGEENEDLLSLKITGNCFNDSLKDNRLSKNASNNTVTKTDILTSEDLNVEPQKSSIATTYSYIERLLVHKLEKFNKLQEISFNNSSASFYLFSNVIEKCHYLRKLDFSIFVNK